MKTFDKYFVSALIILGLFCISGCVTPQTHKDFYQIPETEADWIRDGQPIQFESKLWYPMDVVENLLDEEVYPLGEYREVQFFADKTDVRPYERLYTKFGKHKFRVFEQKNK